MKFLVGFVAVCGAGFLCANEGGLPNLREDGTFRPLSAEEGLKLVEVPEGYRLELVASEPMVQEPVCFAFDGDGALFVCEWLTYMQDQYGTGEHEPKSRVVKLEDTDGDGQMDKRTVFADGLLLPRSIICLHDRVLVKMSHDSTVWAFFDADGDGVAERKEVALKGGRVGGNIEHQSNTFMWNADNRIYSTSEVYGFRGGKLVRESSAGKYGQWGLARDDVGRVYGSSNSIPVQGWHHLGGYPLMTPGEDKDFRRAFSICKVDDATDPGRDVTAIGGQTMIRSEQLKDFKGMYAVPDSVRRMVKLVEFKDVGGKRVASAPKRFEGREFLRSSDVYFRPVWAGMGPDGGLYLADMSRGIVQESQWFPTERTAKPNERWLARYYRTKEWGMLGVNRRGRIYRLVPEDLSLLEKKPELLGMSSVELVGYLAHGNGWWRDEAQKLIVCRGGEGAVVKLREFLGHEKALARLGALRCLDGLGALGVKDISVALRDGDERVRTTAVTLADGKSELLDALVAMGGVENSSMVLSQLYAVYSKSESQKSLNARKLLVSKHGKNGSILLMEKARAQFPRRLAKYAEGHKIYMGLCADCHGMGDKGMRVEGKLMAPLFAKNARAMDKTYVTKVLLKGLQGPLGKEGEEHYAAGIMPPMEGAYDDKQVAQILNYVGFRWGGWKSEMKPEEVGKIRAEVKGRKRMWEFGDLVK